MGSLKKGKGGAGSGGKKTKRGGQEGKCKCHNCGGDHFLQGLQGVEGPN